MPANINTWFSDCFGYEVILAYTGDGLGIKKQDERTQGWLETMKPIIPRQINAVNFSDGAALLVTSEASLEDLHPRLGGEPAVLEKFRPNIVVDGLGAWDEDFWGELTVFPLDVRIVLTANCSRCTSINVDLDKGRMGEGESGKMLKKMMKDRRVDTGSKWSPIFGRYGFPTKGGEIRVGDEVHVSRRNDEHTVWSELLLMVSSLACCVLTFLKMELFPVWQNWMKLVFDNDEVLRSTGLGAPGIWDPNIEHRGDGDSTRGSRNYRILIRLR